jgi:hypothetical protein
VSRTTGAHRSWRRRVATEASELSHRQPPPPPQSPSARESHRTGVPSLVHPFCHPVPLAIALCRRRRADTERVVRVRRLVGRLLILAGRPARVAMGCCGILLCASRPLEIRPIAFF